MTFATPAYFALAAVLVVMLLVLGRLLIWRAAARESFAGPQGRRWPASGFLPRSLLLLVAGVLIVFAAARPQWGSTEQVRQVEGIDIVFVLDISQSMTADDVEPTRLAVAQQSLTRLVDAQRGSRFGLVLFAGTSMKRSLLTSDSQAISQIILGVHREAGLVRAGSDIGSALEEAGSLLQASDNPGRAVLLISDGEDFAGTYAAAAQALDAQGIVVYTAGVGTAEGAGLFDTTADGERVPKLDAGGNPVVTRLEEDALRAIAAGAEGQYVHLEGGTSGLLPLDNELNRLDQTPFGAETQRLPIERFQIFAAAAIALLLVSWFLPSRLPLPSLTRITAGRRRHSLALILLAVLLSACGSDALRDRNQEANERFQAGDYQGALAIYQALLSERPDIDRLSYNAGNALHRLEAYERAVTETQRALPPADREIGPRVYYSLGNHLLAAERLEEAYVAYRNALLLDPDDRDAKHNLEVTLALINLRDNPPPNDSSADTPEEGEEEPTDGSPAPDATESPDGAGEPSGSPTPEPGEPGEAPAASGSDAPADGELTEEQIAALERALEDALAGLDEDLTFEEAIRILDLLRQQQESRLPPAGGSEGPDY